MVLSPQDIVEIIKTPRNPHIKGYQEKHARLDMFFNGSETLADYLEKIQNFENVEQKNLRDKLARSTKDTLKKVLNPFSKVFTASGGSEVYNIKPEANKKAFADLVGFLPEGISLRKWMEVYWSEAYITDPNGIILIEAEDGDNPRSYPTYKNITAIHDYQTKWKKVEYVVLMYGKFKIGNEEVNVYRVFDDEKDALYYLKGDDLKEFIMDEDQTTSVINHNKGFVPAVIVSDLVEKKTKGKKSFIDSIDELLDEFLRDSSVLSIYKFFHLYPKYWQYVTKCNKCKGDGTIIKNNETTTCTSCSGTGYNLKKDVSDGVYLPIPEGEQPKIAPDIAGFVAPPIDAWQKMVEELERLQKEMEFAIWGSYTEADKSETATGRFIDAQPVMDALRSVSESAENTEYQIAVYMAKWMFSIAADETPDIAVNYGKRFLVELPDQLWKKYIEAKKDKAPISALDQHYKEYLLGQYHNDMEMYTQKLKEFYLEPFVHYSADELKGLISPEEMKRKVYFGEWISETTDFSAPIEKLKGEFESFINQKPNYETTTENQGDR